MEGLYWRSFAFIRGSSSQKGFFADFDSTPTPNADIAFLLSLNPPEWVKRAPEVVSDYPDRLIPVDEKVEFPEKHHRIKDYACLLSA